MSVSSPVSPCVTILLFDYVLLNSVCSTASISVITFGIRLRKCEITLRLEGKSLEIWQNCCWPYPKSQGCPGISI